MFIAKGKQCQATRSQTKLITGSQALADPFLDKYKWSSLTCSSEYRVFLVINPLQAQTSMVCSQRAKVCVYLTKDVLLGQRLIIWSSSPSSCKQHVEQCQNIVLWRGYNHRSMRRKSLLLWWSSITCGKLPGMSFTLNVRFLNKSSWTSLSSYPYHLLRCLLSSSRISCKEILRWY